jgi:hypothetical protein
MAPGLLPWPWVSKNRAHLENPKMDREEKLREYLTILDAFELPKEIDFQTIGKLVVADILRNNEQKLLSQEPDAEGFLTLEGSLRHSIKIDSKRKPARYICCWCHNQNGFFCLGYCCGSPF